MPTLQVLVTCFLLVVTFRAACFFYGRWVEETLWRIVCVVFSIIDVALYLVLLYYVFLFWRAGGAAA